MGREMIGHKFEQYLYTNSADILFVLSKKNIRELHERFHLQFLIQHRSRANSYCLRE